MVKMHGPLTYLNHISSNIHEMTIELIMTEVNILDLKHHRLNEEHFLYSRQVAMTRL